MCQSPSPRSLPLCLLLSLACGGSTTQAPNTTPVQIRSGQRTSEQESAAGDRAFLTIAIRPHALREVSAAVRAVVPSNLGEVADQIGNAALFDAWLADISRGMRAQEVPPVLSWSGLDPSRPIYVRVAESADDLTSAMEVAAGQPSTLRHVLALPTTNADGLRRTLAPFVAECERRGDGAFECPTGHVRFAEVEEWLFVVHYPGLSREEELNASSLMGDVRGVGAWALGGASPFSGLLRVGSIRGAAAHHGAHQIVRALVLAAGGDIDSVRAAGMGELMGAYVRSSAYGREVEALGFTLQSEPLSFALSGELSEVGAARWNAAPAPDLIPASEAPIVVRSSYDVNALVQAAPNPVAFDIFGSDYRAARRAFRECGVACAFRVLFEPAGYASLISEGQPLALAADELRLEVHANLPAGTIDFDADVATMIPRLFPAGTVLFGRTRVEGMRWSGGVALRAESAERARALAEGRPVSTPPAQNDGDPRSLLCLMRLGENASAQMRLLSESVANHVPALIERGRAVLSEGAECVTDPRHAADRDGYLSAFERAASALGEPLVPGL